MRLIEDHGDGNRQLHAFVVLPNGELVNEEDGNVLTYGNSPIQERAEEGMSSPSKDHFADTDLHKISLEVKKKDQSRKLVLWEKNELRNHWEDNPIMAQKKANAIRSNGNRWDLPNKTLPQDVAPPRKHNMHHENLNSKVPALADYDNFKQRRQPIRERDSTDPLHALPMKNRELTNIFYKSSL